jgi:hypothetical protein
MDEQEILRTSRNISVIIGYLRTHLEGFVIRVEEQPPSRIVFSLTSLTSGERLTLAVLWPALGDKNNTPDLIQQKMNNSDIARRLRDEKTYFWTVSTASGSGATGETDE